ncbi:MAG: START-like domain-containing protein [Paludibacteraceae bacterium]|nr:START-like domain-containing protein [Paludibacteraceae bacterium]
MKEKFQLEYVFSNISMSVLWNSISTPSGLGEWFADKVDLDPNDPNVFVFYWGKTCQTARLLNNRTGSYVKFRWDDDKDDEAKPYFELRMSYVELTNDVVLTITDFVEEDEREEATKLWETQVAALKMAAGL